MMNPPRPSDTTLPLSGVTVLDRTEGVATTTTRVLAELGADVIRIEPPEGSPSRHRPPLIGRTASIFDATHNAGKRSVVLTESPDDRAAFQRLVAQADILVSDTSPAPRTQDLLDLNPRLVVAHVSDFGLTGPYRTWTATEHVLQAMSGLLSNSGRPDGPPVFAPATILSESAALHAAWPVLVAYWQSLHTGQGDVVEISLFDAAIQTIDPGFGIAGSAGLGVPTADGPRGRPDVAFRYPVFACADGHVRICLLAARQWHAMRRWLGEPEEFAGPEYDLIPARFAARDRLYPLIADLFRDHTREHLVTTGQQMGVPIEGIVSTAQAVSGEHFAARGTFVRHHLAGTDDVIPVVDGLFELDGDRSGIRRAAPTLGADGPDILGPRRPTPQRERGPFEHGAADPQNRRALEGIRVLDLGVIVVGAELGRLFADQGADVIKVESRAFVDGSRLSAPDSVSHSFAWGHRNKRSLGLNLRSPEGIELFLQLARQADLIVSNFKPGTMESLGLSLDRLRAVNPDIIVVESSAFGSTGPWSRRMGYGPLVRAAIGLTDLWRTDDREPEVADAATTYPDHIAARAGAVAALALLVGRLRGLAPRQVSVAQTEVVLSQLADFIALESLDPESAAHWARHPDGEAPSGLYPCAGDDEWCAIAVRNDQEWQALCRVIRRPDLGEDPNLTDSANRNLRSHELRKVVTQWTERHGPRQAMTILQEAGVPAGMMLRHADHLADPNLVARSFFRTLPQPQFEGGLPSEGGPATFRNVPEPGLAPAPVHGQHTRDVMSQLLAIAPAELDALVSSGVLEVPA